MNCYKMATPQEKAQSVSWFIETKLDVQTHESTEASIERPTIMFFILSMAQELYGARAVLDAVRSGQPGISGENIECVRQAFSRFPMKSIYSAARELPLPPATVHKVLHTR